MKTSLCLLTSTLLLASCAKDSLRIQGTITNVPDGDIFVSILDSNLQRQLVDTFQIKDGAFDYDKQLSLDDAECVILSQKDRGLAVLFVGNDNVTLEGDALKPNDVVITGSASNDLLKNFQDNIPEMDRLSRLNDQLRIVGNDVDKRDEIYEEMRSIQLEQMAYTEQFIGKNATNPVGPFLLCNFLGSFGFEKSDSLTHIFEHSIPDNKFVKALRRQLEAARPEFEAQQRVSLGSEAPDFVLTDISGHSVSLSSLRGKVVLLDFWASWCQPCRRNNKSLAEVHRKFASRGLQIFGVSLDTRIDNWRNAVSEDKLPGIQVVDTAGIVANDYCIRTVPSTFVIDPDGLIVAKDASVEKLFADIENLLNQSK